MKKIIVSLIILCSFFSSKINAQNATYSTLTLTNSLDQLRFEMPNENRYWILSKPSSNYAFALYSPKEGGWFTTWQKSTGDMVMHKGKFGIGATSPSANFHLKNYSTGSPTLLIQRNGYVGGSGGEAGTELGRILFKNDHTNNYGAMIKGVIGSNGWAPNTGLDFFTSSGGSYNFAMRIDDNKNVGIATTSPTEKLHVNGLIRIPEANSVDNDSPGLVYIGDDDFLYDGQYINHYGFGFHGYQDGSTSFTDPTNTYISGFFGVDVFTSGASRIRINRNGNVGIGTTSPGNKLEVNGTIRSKEVIVEASNWPDYVFEEEYNLPTLSEIEAFIKANKHLPEVPSAQEVEENGILLGSMNTLLLKKMEEMTLYMIQVQKEVTTLKQENIVLTKKIELLENKK